MLNTHFNGSKIPMFVVEFVNTRGCVKQVKFFNPRKAGDFYTLLKSSPSIVKVKEFKRLLTAAEKRAELLDLKNRKG